MVPHKVHAVRAHGIGEISGEVRTVVLRLEAEDGTVGWGEAAPWAPFVGTPEAAFAALDLYYRPYVQDSSVAAFAETLAACDHALAGHPDARAALETALLDLHAKILGKPLWALFGEKTHSTIPLSISIADPVWDRDLDLIARAYASGIRLFKFKTGFVGPEFDRMRIAAVKAEYPSADLRIDYNQGLSVEAAMEEVPALDRLGLRFIEQPVRAQEWEAMAALQSRLETPLLADESVFNSFDLKRGAAEKIARGMSVKIFKAGGPLQGFCVAKKAQDLGWQVYGGDMFESGISHLAGLHMIAASTGFDWGCEYYHANWHLERDLLAERFPEENGQVLVPDAPGLGAAVDEDYIRATAL